MHGEDIETYIYEHIPIVKANGFSISDDDTPYARVGGKLIDHVNHRNSAFGGSLSTALILAAWATVRNLIREAGYPHGVIVIQTQTIKFLDPVLSDFTARVAEISPRTLARFTAMLAKFGKARLEIEAGIYPETPQNDERGTEVKVGNKALATFCGDFVVVLKDR